MSRTYLCLVNRYYIFQLAFKDHHTAMHRILNVIAGSINQHVIKVVWQHESCLQNSHMIKKPALKYRFIFLNS